MKIGVDIDEVLCEYLSSLIKYHNHKYLTLFKLEDFHSYYFWQVWGGNLQEAIDKVYEFHDTNYFKEAQVVKGSIQSIEKLSQNHELYAITSRQNDVKEQTLKWLENHFKNAFKQVHFTNGYAKNGSSITKLEICKKLDIEVLIEDSIDYAKECCNDLNVILINKPWNKNDFTHPNLKKVNNWQEILKEIENLNLTLQNKN